MNHLLIFNLRTDAQDDVLGFTTDWINALAARVPRVTVITMYAGAIAVAPNVRVLSVGREHGWSEPRRLLVFYRHLAGVLRDDPPDGCFAHMIPLFAVLAWPLLRPRGIPIVLWYAHKATPPMLRLAHALVDQVVTSTKTGFQLSSTKVRQIGQGIDTERFQPGPPAPAGAPLRVLSLGRLSRIKRVEVGLEAVAAIRRERPDLAVRLAIVGGALSDDDRAYEAELRALCSSLGVDAIVSFDGPIAFPDVHARFAAADVYVNASDTDSADKTVLEAMSCAVPVITSNLAFHEILGPALARDWLIPKRDPATMAARLIALAERGPAGRRALGERLRAIVEAEHGLPALAGKILEALARA